MCVSENIYDCGDEEVRAGVCVCAQLPFGLSLSDCQLEEQKILRSMICVAATSRPELVLFLVFKTSAGTSVEVGYGDCRPVL